ncbi:MAG: hypothetical protein GW780_02530 [Candidatus Aenigmarchaeota archaeon]|nr:hypothetical protein [Candidatus Aenigmarchaeota archaeon]NCS71020.1 hypothetical protein [Candidatus Aenigmarchaeota archaeon]
MRNELEKKLIDEKIRFTRIWVDHMLNSTNKKWSSEQKRFINSIIGASRKNKIDS